MSQLELLGLQQLLSSGTASGSSTAPSNIPNLQQLLAAGSTNFQLGSGSANLQQPNGAGSTNLQPPNGGVNLQQLLGSGALQQLLGSGALAGHPIIQEIIQTLNSNCTLTV